MSFPRFSGDWSGLGAKPAATPPPAADQTSCREADPFPRSNGALELGDTRVIGDADEVRRIAVELSRGVGTDKASPPCSTVPLVLSEFADDQP